MVAVEEVTKRAGGRWFFLRRGGVMVVLDAGGPYLPRIVYWGNDLGELSEDEVTALPLARSKCAATVRPTRGSP